MRPRPVQPLPTNHLKLSNGEPVRRTDLGELRNGSLEVRIADSEAELKASQNLRYRVFYQELSATPTEEMVRLERDFDMFDPFCDHLIVVDHAKGSGPDAVIGSYRLMVREAADQIGGFYSVAEFDISRILAYRGQVMELGRSCVANQYRNRLTMQLLWRGIAAYVFLNDVKIMFGCASLSGSDPERLALPLSYLYHRHLAPVSVRPRALENRYVDMNRLAADKIHDKQALVGLPPLVKGYLRLGGVVGEGAVVDYQFNTTDVCVIVVTEEITERYYRHYERSAGEALGG